MTALTPSQILGYARGAGFSGDLAITMTAIALAESGGRTDAVGDTRLQDARWGPSIGLWQVRSLNAQRGTGKERDATRLMDPAFNARSARIIHAQQGLRAWSVYSSGSYEPYMSAARGAGGPPGRGGTTPTDGSSPIDKVGGAAASAAGGVLSGVDALGGFFGALAQHGTWVRVLQVVGGAGLVVAGLSWLGKDIVGPVANVAADVIPQARALKAAGAIAGAAK